MLQPIVVVFFLPMFFYLFWSQHSPGRADEPGHHAGCYSNFGLAAGAILPALFSSLVLMTIVTTLMATPIFNWVMRSKISSSHPYPALKSKFNDD